jgi:hypothetical protein
LVGIIIEYNGYNPVADFNSDGSIDVMDIIRIIELILD